VEARSATSDLFLPLPDIYQSKLTAACSLIFRYLICDELGTFAAIGV
jgi:hypothetical protein